MIHVIILLISLAFNVTTAFAKISEPDVIFYGVATQSGTPLTGGTATLSVNGSSDVLASSPIDGSGNFTLRVYLDALSYDADGTLLPQTPGTARIGDQVIIYLNGVIAAKTEIPDRGVAINLDADTDFMKDSNHNGIPDLWEALHPGDNGSGDMNGNGISDLQEWLNGNDPAACVWNVVDGTHAETCVFNAKVLKNCLADAETDRRHNTIKIVKGTYKGNFKYTAGWKEDFDLQIVGGYAAGCATHSFDPESTVLDGDGKGAVLVFDSASAGTAGTVRVKGFHIKNGNAAGQSGGGIMALSSQGRVELFGNIISGSSADSGGGIYASSDSGSIDLTDNIIFGNTAGEGAGVKIATGTGAIAILNNTIALNGNPANTAFGGGLSVFMKSSSASVDITNNILYSNAAALAIDLYLDRNGLNNLVVVRNNDIGNYLIADNSFVLDSTNINADPQFADSANGDFHLSSTSPCVDAGDGTHALPDTDFEGDVRVSGAHVDIGADEYIDEDSPSITQVTTITPAGSYKAGDRISIAVGFSEAVSTGGLTLELSSGASVNTGPLSGALSYSGVYTVNPGENSSALSMTGITGSITDAAGNVNSALSVPDGKNIPNTAILIIDTKKPVIGIAGPSRDSIIAPVLNINGSASDDGSGIAKLELFINGVAMSVAGTTVWSYDWTVPSDGVYVIDVRATDNAGNQETVEKTVTTYKRSPGVVEAAGRQLLVSGNPFVVKGVNYLPVPIGDDPATTPPFGDYFTTGYSGIYERDLPILREMGANTVRIWSWDDKADHAAFLDKAYNGGSAPVYVILGFPIDPGLDIDPGSPTNVREKMKADFRAMVAAYKNHPAILMWSIGDGLNNTGMYGNTFANLFSLINEMAKAAHDEEGVHHHPVTTPLADANLIAVISTHDSLVPSLDVWSAKVFRGNTFGTLFADYKQASGKPFLIMEYGIDAFDNVNGNEYEAIGAPHQSEYAVALWGEIASNADTCVGGSIMEFSDGWWIGQSAGNCEDDGSSFHGTCGYSDSSQPDGYDNEEWWGITRISKADSGPDILKPRVIFYALKGLWLPTVLSPDITVDASILDFGSVNMGTNARKSVTVTNAGTGNLSMGTAQIGGANAADYRLENDKCSGRTLIPSGTCMIDAVFAPKSLFAKNAVLAFYSNAPGKNVMSITLSGTGIDDLAPAGSLLINGGVAATKSTAVTLTISAGDYSAGAIQMCISNNLTCTSWAAYSGTKSWTLPTGDGVKTVNLWLKDVWGNVNASPYSASITMDTTGPVDGSLSAKGGNGQNVLTWSGFTDASSGIAGYKLFLGATAIPTSCSGTPIYSGNGNTFTHTGLMNGKAYYYRLCAVDKAGNMSKGATASAKPAPESKPPAGSLLINGGAAATKSTAVALTISASDDSPGAIQMCISNNSTCTSWAAYSATKSWTLTTGDGVKTVNLWLKDAWGNVNASPYSASITMDTTGPVDGSLSAKGGNGQNVLTWSGFTDASSGIAGYKLFLGATASPTSCSGTPIYSGNGNTFTHTGLMNGKAYYYRLCAVDKAGNMSKGATASAKPAPEGNPPAGSLLINGGAAATKSTAVTLTISASDDSPGAIQMCISNNSTCTSWAAYMATKSWTLTTGDGVKTVNLWLKDVWGNVNASPYSASITLDTK